MYSVSKKIASRYLTKTTREAYGRRRDDEDYEPEPERVDCPDDIDSAVRDEFESVVMKLVKKIDTAFRRVGWRVNHGINDNDIDDGVQRYEYEFELSVKGGQKLIADRKKIVADGNYQPSFIIRFLSEEGESEQDTFEEEYWSGRYDDYDLSTRSHWVEYTCGGTTLDYFGVEPLTRGSVSKKMERAFYTEKDIPRFVVEYTKSFFLNNSRSKWKKRAYLGETMEKSVENIADRYMTAATKGYFIHRSPNPRQQPSTIYISDGRNVIYLETGGRYKGKFVPIESAKMPPLSEMDSLPIGETHSGIIIDGNVVSEIASVLRDPSYEVVAPSLGLVRDITYSAPFNPKQEWDMLIGQPIAFGEPTGIPEIDRKHGLK